MKLPKLRKLNALGMSHLIVPVIAVLVIGGIGSYLLTQSHADSLAPTAATAKTPGFVTLNGPNGSQMTIYTSDNVANGPGILSANAELIPNSSGLTLSSASVRLVRCSTTNNPCSTATKSSTVIHYPGGNGIPNDYYVSAAGAAVNGSDLYQACVTFTTSGGWNESGKCSGYVFYGDNYTQISSSYQTTTATPSFYGCVVSQTSSTIDLKIESFRSNAKAISFAVVWSPNAQTTSPTGDILNTKWVGQGFSISEAVIPKDNQMVLSYQTKTAGYGFTAPATPPTNLKSCD